MNLDIYPLLAFLLGTQAAPNNGSLLRIKDVLKDSVLPQPSTIRHCMGNFYPCLPLTLTVHVLDENPYVRTNFLTLVISACFFRDVDFLN